jgi:hypothetical protein
MNFEPKFIWFFSNLIIEYLIKGKIIWTKDAEKSKTWNTEQILSDNGYERKITVWVNINIHESWVIVVNIVTE